LDLVSVSPPAQYFLEQQVITPDETSDATRNNNVSYNDATVGSCDPNLCTGPICGVFCLADRSCAGCGDCVYPLTFPVGAPSFCQQPAIRAWKDSDPNVFESDPIPDHSPGQIGGQFILAAKARSVVAGCLWEYEYALYNMNSDTSAGSFRVPLPTGLSPVDLQDIRDSAGFHDISYHSGEIWDGTDWTATVVSGSITWATTETHTQNPNANALRWGTLYNFRFEAKRAPVYDATVTIGLFKTAPDSVPGVSVAPGPNCAAPQDGSVNPKNRFLSIIPATCSTVSTAIRVKMVDLQHPDPANVPQYPPPNFTTFDTKLDGVCVGGSLVGHHCHLKPVKYCSGGGTCSSLAACTAAGEANGCARWVGKPGAFLEFQDTPSLGNFTGARLQCTPFYYNWSTEDLVHVTGAEIVPSSTYDVQVLGASCMGNETACADVSCALQITTARSGDVEAPFNPPSTTTQPDAIDIAEVLNHFFGVPGALKKAAVQLQPNLPELNADVSALDIVAVTDAVSQHAYAFSGPCACPSAVTCGSMACTSPSVCVTAFGAGAMCVKTCSGGTNAGDPCINNSHCPPTGVGICGAGFCRDRCGRCTPP